MLENRIANLSNECYLYMIRVLLRRNFVRTTRIYIELKVLPCLKQRPQNVFRNASRYFADIKLYKIGLMVDER